MIFSFSMFLQRHFWTVLCSLCFILTGPIAHKTMPSILDSTKWRPEERMLYEKIHGLSQEHVRALNIMARTVYGETRDQHKTARAAVAHVILNRSKNEPVNVPAVVFRRKQFTCWSDHNRPVLLAATAKDRAFLRSIDACVSAFKAKKDITNGADHYHATYTKPYWKKSKRMKSTGQFGRHIFYKRS